MGVPNTWAEPEGYETKPPDIAYRILDRTSGEVSMHCAEPTYDTPRGRYYYALSYQDQQFADAITALIQRACAYFYEQDNYMPLDGWADARVSDDEVRVRIRRLNLGENAREAERVRIVHPEKRAYPLDELPWAQQRALIEQIDRLKAEWQFEIVGEVAASARPMPEPTSPPPQALYDWFVDTATLEPYWGEW